MFEDIHEIAENSAYLKAVEEKDVSRTQHSTPSGAERRQHARNMRTSWSMRVAGEGRRGVATTRLQLRHV